MNDKDPILEKHEHLDLRLDRLRLVALALPAALPEPSLRRLLVHEIKKLKNELFAHFDFEEEGGYFPDVYRHRPNLAAKVDALRVQHDSLRREVEELSLRCGSKAVDTRALQNALLGLLGRIKEHETAENEIVQTYLSVDIGVGG